MRPNIELFDWPRGVGFRSQERNNLAIWLWFYEWNMFGAMRPGQHTAGTHEFSRAMTPGAGEVVISSSDITLAAVATPDGASLSLTVRNQTEAAFPPLAALVPCLSPGPDGAKTAQFRNRETYFVGPNGLEALVDREIHFNAALRESVDLEADDGAFAWSSKWPTGESDSLAGLILREATAGDWVCGIAWEQFLSAQGNNPWECMHLSVLIGPILPGESVTVRGRVYLFEGDREELLMRYRNSFGDR